MAGEQSPVSDFAKRKRSETLSNLVHLIDAIDDDEDEAPGVQIEEPPLIVVSTSLPASRIQELSPSQADSPFRKALTRGKAKKTKVIESNFRLETMPRATMRAVVLIFYLSIVFAFFAKIWSEHLLKTEDICGNDATGVDFDSWNSDACRTNYTQNQSIPVSRLPFESIPCPGELCYKWDGEVPSLNLLHRMVFPAFIAQMAPPESVTVQLWLVGWAHRLDDDGGVTHTSTLPGADDSGPELETNDTSKWSSRRYKLTCKKGRHCDVIIASEPLFAVNHRHLVQVLLLNAELLRDVSQDPPHLNIGFVHVGPFVTALDLTCRYLFMIMAVVMVVDFCNHLGLPRWCPVWCKQRCGPEEVRSKRWMTEQRWVIFILCALILYLNPLALPMLAIEAEEGRNVDGDHSSWRDRIFLFIDHNIAVYFLNVLRIFELTLLACCLEEEGRPKMTFRVREYRRACLYWIAIIWIGCVITVDIFRLNSGYHDYYHKEQGENVYDFTEPSALLQGGLLLLWIVGMVVYFFLASFALSRQTYWTTRSRQLSFRFFFFLYVWHIAYTVTEILYCWWKYTRGRHVYESLVCTDVSSLDTGDLIANSVFILVLGFVFGPATHKGELPPDPFGERREWITTRWGKEWVRYVNTKATSTMYFFFWATERFHFNLVNGMLQHRQRGLHGRGLFGAAVQHAKRVMWNFRERSKPKRLFCLELAVDMLCLSWEVYGEEPGTDHSRELSKTDPMMPIDCERHGFELLDVVNGSVESGAASKLEIQDARHPHTLEYRYLPNFKCARPHCPHGHEEVGLGVAYVCTEEGCDWKDKNGSRYALCRRCFKLGHHPNGPPLQQPLSTDDKKTSFRGLPERLDEGVISMLTRQEEEIKFADLQTIICRDDDRVVIAVRGTHNLRNVKTDVQFFRDVFEPMVDEGWRRGGFLDVRGHIKRIKNRFGWGLPRCHRGFRRAFDSVAPEVVERLKPILDTHPHHEVVVTGHSLGGAIAMLLACEIRRKFGRVPTVYTYGSPRVGNRTFAKIYDSIIPDTFRVVNQSDLISTLPWSLFGVFMHCGKEVAIDKSGNLIIEPTFIERFIAPTKVKPHTGGVTLQLRAEGNIADHQMSRYAVSLNAVSVLFGVGDCIIDMKPRSRPMWMESRRRFDDRGRCSMCGEEASFERPGHCAVSGNPHKPWLHRTCGPARDGGAALRKWFEARQVSYKSRDSAMQHFSVAHGLLSFESDLAIVDQPIVTGLKLEPDKMQIRIFPGGMVSRLPEMDAVPIVEALILLLRRTMVDHDLDPARVATAPQREQSVLAALGGSASNTIERRGSLVSVTARKNLTILGAWVDPMGDRASAAGSRFLSFPRLTSAASSVLDSASGNRSVRSATGADELLRPLLGPVQVTATMEEEDSIGCSRASDSTSGGKADVCGSGAKAAEDAKPEAKAAPGPTVIRGSANDLEPGGVLSDPRWQPLQQQQGQWPSQTGGRPASGTGLVTPPSLPVTGRAAPSLRRSMTQRGSLRPGSTPQVTFSFTPPQDVLDPVAAAPPRRRGGRGAASARPPLQAPSTPVTTGRGAGVPAACLPHGRGRGGRGAGLPPPAPPTPTVDTVYAGRAAAVLSPTGGAPAEAPDVRLVPPPRHAVLAGRQ
eukprot:TRINITY_DN21267_c0_g1_i1.p1 TRINITY_DN21267_c0_g1~~TRINITY_DN21267_c0_g1_i1.p1  ORF type:complete len:1646 (+),score=434.82 TRINITY_DN21267_c0_g1_i1:63-4940(+)